MIGYLIDAVRMAYILDAQRSVFARNRTLYVGVHQYHFSLLNDCKLSTSESTKTTQNLTSVITSFFRSISSTCQKYQNQ